MSKHIITYTHKCTYAYTQLHMRTYTHTHKRVALT